MSTLSELSKKAALGWAGMAGMFQTAHVKAHLTRSASRAFIRRAYVWTYNGDVSGSKAPTKAYGLRI